MSKTDQLFEKIVGQLVDTIESENHGKWTKPWISVIAGAGFALNPTPKHKGYHGMNQLVLMVHTAVFGYTANVWATYKQWKKLGGQVRKGESGTLLVKWGVTYECDQHGKSRNPCETCPVGEISRSMWASPFTVFNVDQQDGWEMETPDLGDAPARIERAEEFITGTGAQIEHRLSNDAYYLPDQNRIVLPLREQFDTVEGYYGTAFHELTHWTAGEGRLERANGKFFGDEKYAGEELVAELGSAFLGAKFGIEVEPHQEHAAYLASWLNRLKAQPRDLYTAAKEAQRAVEFLTNEVERKEEAA